MLLERLGTPRVGEVEAAGDIEVARGASFALHRAAEPDATAEQILAAQRIAIFFDVLASAFVLWAAMGRDIRRFYEPSMEKAVFETGLRYYLWGGKESYNIRQQMRERAAAESAAHTEKTAEIDHGSAHLPAFDRQKCDKTEGPPGSSCFGTLRRHEFPRGEKSLFPSIIGRRKPCNFLHKRNLPFGAQ